MNVLSPSASLLCKLASIAVHAEELLSPGGHDFDRVALSALLADAELRRWFVEMRALALIPEKRS